MTKLAPQLPKSEGLYGVNRQLIETPAHRQVLIVVVDCKKTETDVDTGFTEATARIQSVEPLLDDGDAELALQLLQRAADRRNGRQALFDLRTATGVITAEDLRS